MGLDIYVHRISTKKCNRVNKKIELNHSNTNWSEISEECDAQAKNAAVKDYEKFISIMEGTDSDAYQQVYEKELKKFGDKHFSYPSYHLKCIGYDEKYTDKGRVPVITSVSTDTLAEMKDEIFKHFYAPHIAYWRKANFIYAYFQKSLVDEVAWITEKQAKDLLSRAEKVLRLWKEGEKTTIKEKGYNDQIYKYKKASDELAERMSKVLCTQSGFFFGSTEYDEYYIYDIESTIKQMKKVVKYIEKGDLCYISMSW